MKAPYRLEGKEMLLSCAFLFPRWAVTHQAGAVMRRPSSGSVPFALGCQKTRGNVLSPGAGALWSHVRWLGHSSNQAGFTSLYAVDRSAGSSYADPIGTEEPRQTNCISLQSRCWTRGPSFGSHLLGRDRKTLTTPPG